MSETVAVPIKGFQDLLGLIDPPPVKTQSGTVMVFVNPHSAEVLTRISAIVRRMQDAALAHQVAAATAEQAQQAEPVNQQRAGVYRKFNVSRTDGRDKPGGDRHGAEYFVLDVTHDKFAKPALAAYAAACRNDYPALADDMVRRYGIAQQQAEPVGWRVAIPGRRHTDKWDSARVSDYNDGWNDYQKAVKSALAKLEGRTE